MRNPAAFCGIVGFRPTPGMVPMAARDIGWSGLPVLGPMARTVADTCLLLGSMASDDRCDPLATTLHGRTVRRPGDVYPPAALDLSRLRVAVTPDFGFAPTERIVRETFAEKLGRFAHVFAGAEAASPDCSGTDDVFAVLRAVVIPEQTRRQGAGHPGTRRPECARQRGRGTDATPPRTSRGR